jgi:hypothetical protein
VLANSVLINANGDRDLILWVTAGAHWRLCPDGCHLKVVAKARADGRPGEMAK